MSEFDYSNTDGPDIDTIRSIAAEMANAGNPRPPTDAERQAHEQFLAECRERDEQRQLEYRRRQEEIANKERIEAERQAAIAREKARLENEERDRRRSHDRSLTQLLDHAVAQKNYRDGFAKSAQMAAQRRRFSSVMDGVLATATTRTDGCRGAGRRWLGGFRIAQFRRRQMV